MTDFLKKIRKQLTAKSSRTAKAATLKFVPSSERVYGLRMPVLNAMAKQYRAGGFELVESLWKSGAFEEKILAGKILRLRAKKDPDKTIELIAKFSKHITDWAVCDTLGMQSVKPILKIKQSAIFSLANQLTESKNLWQRRLALVESYTKEKSLHPAIHKLLRALESDPEYYVRKAVEWIKRNLRKNSPENRAP